MDVTKRGELDDNDQRRLLAAQAAATTSAAEYRALAIEMTRRSSIREVARVLDVSTNTIQRWKREAGA